MTRFGPLLAMRDAPAPAPDAREQRARQRARKLPRRDLAEVIPLGGPHPSMTLACEACGAEVEALLYCGVVLCVPCWKRKAARDSTEILSTLQTERKRHGRDNLRVRFVTLTIRNGPDLRERMGVLQSAFVRMAHRKFWKLHVDGAVAKTEVTLSEEWTWHPHLSFLTVGRYMDQGVLSDQWAKATKGEGYIVDIRAVDDADSIPVEIGKYVAKPMAETKEGRTRLEDWPEEKRRELAALLAGKPRTRWWCSEGRSASYARCHSKEHEPGFRPHACDGEFRIELTGFRRLRWYGTLRRAHSEAKAARFAARLESRCAKCGVGKLFLTSWKDWDDLESERVGWPKRLLPSIRGHQTATAFRAEASKKAASGQIGTREGAAGPPWGDLKEAS